LNGHDIGTVNPSAKYSHLFHAGYSRSCSERTKHVVCSGKSSCEL